MKEAVPDKCCGGEDRLQKVKEYMSDDNEDKECSLTQAFWPHPSGVSGCKNKDKMEITTQTYTEINMVWLIIREI